MYSIKLRRLLITLAVLVCVAGIAVFAMLRFAHTPLDLTHAEKTISIPKGMHVPSMMRLLEQQRILTPLQTIQMRLWIRFCNADKKIKAGTYLLPNALTPDQIMKKLVDGDVVQFAVTIIEGQTTQDFFEKLKQNPAVVKTVLDLPPQEILAALNAPYTHLEGLFFPDTYFFPDGTTDLVLLKMAYDTMQRHLQTAWAQRSSQSILKTPYEALIMASIIEKEGRFHQEHAQISGVFHRRLAKKMRLQADPTVLYGFGDNRKDLNKADLKFNHPYNTYVHHALPPTPIALPGLHAIKAAVQPDTGNALYFVAKGDGSHHFSDTLTEHNRAVLQYQILKQEVIKKDVVKEDTQ